MPNNVSVIFNNGSNYDYHSIIKESGNDFEGQFEGLWENTEKYKTFSLPIENEIIKIDKDDNEDISYKMKSVDRPKFMPSLLSTLVNTLAEWIEKN